MPKILFLLYCFIGAESLFNIFLKGLGFCRTRRLDGFGKGDLITKTTQWQLVGVAAWVINFFLVFFLCIIIECGGQKSTFSIWKIIEVFSSHPYFFLVFELHLDPWFVAPILLSSFAHRLFFMCPTNAAYFLQIHVPNKCCLFRPNCAGHRPIEGLISSWKSHFIFAGVLGLLVW